MCVWWCEFLAVLCINPAQSFKILTFLGLVLLKICHVQINPFQMVTHTHTTLTHSGSADIIINRHSVLWCFELLKLVLVNLLENLV